MMISRLQELVQNLYVEVLFVRCTWCLSAKRKNFNIFTFSYFYYYVTQITKIYAHTHNTTRKCNARTCTRLWRKLDTQVRYFGHAVASYGVRFLRMHVQRFDQYVDSLTQQCCHDSKFHCRNLFDICTSLLQEQVSNELLLTLCVYFSGIVDDRPGLRSVRGVRARSARISLSSFTYS